MFLRLVAILCVLMMYNMTWENGTVEALFFRPRQPQTVLVGGGPNGQSMLMGSGQSLVLNGNGGAGQSMMLGNGQSVLMNGNSFSGGNMVFRTARLSPLQQLFSNTADQEVMILQNPGIQGFSSGFGFRNSTNHTRYYKNEKHYHNHYHTHKKPMYHHYRHRKHHYEKPEYHQYEKPEYHHYDHHHDHDKYDDKHSHYSSHHHYNDDDDGMEDDEPEETKINQKVLHSKHNRPYHSGSESSSGSEQSRRSRIQSRNKSNGDTTTASTPRKGDTYLEDEPGNEIVQQGSVGPTRIDKVVHEPNSIHEDDDEGEDYDDENDTFLQIMNVIPFKNLFS